MTKFEQSFAVNCNIDDVWNFYTDIRHLLVITPADIAITVEPIKAITEGAEFKLTGNLIRNSEWKARITYCKPYEYVDEMIDGPFKTWKHLHMFVASNNNNDTKVIEIVEYELPYGTLGKLTNLIYVHRKIRQIFEYRKRATVNALEKHKEV